MRQIIEYVKQASNFHFPRMVNEYLSTKVAKPSIIKATDETIKKIVKGELDRLGHDADLNHIDVSEVTDMSFLFSWNCNEKLGSSKYEDLNPDISKWDVSNVEGMDFMFYEAKMFNCDIANWDVKKVENMYCMFHGCRNFNQDLSGWNVSNVKDNKYMFIDCHIKEEFKPKFNI